MEHRILKVATCLSLSGRSMLTYHLGASAAGDVCFRIWDTDGKGIYSKEWVCAGDIQKVLAQHQSIAAPLLLPLFKVGRSVNSAGFLLAALKNEGLVTNHPEEPHRYVRVESLAFVEEVTRLMKAGVSLDSEQVPAMKKRRRGGRVPAWSAETVGGEG
jgi:hypothetical protein